MVDGDEDLPKDVNGVEAGRSGRSAIFGPAEFGGNGEAEKEVEELNAEELV